MLQDAAAIKRYTSCTVGLRAEDGIVDTDRVSIGDHLVAQAAMRWINRARATVTGITKYMKRKGAMESRWWPLVCGSVKTKTASAISLTTKTLKLANKYPH